MRKAIVFGASVALLAPILCAQRQETGLAIQSWKYDHETHGQFGDAIRGVLVLELANLSGKDITAYNISITLTSADGSTDYTDGRPNTPGEHTEEMLGPLIYEELYGKGWNSEYTKEHGIIAAGTSRSLMLPQAKDICDVKAVVDMVIYADSTAEVLNDRAFTQIASMRKESLTAMRKVSKVIKQVFADPTITDATAVAVKELTRELTEAGKEGNQEMGLRSAVADLERPSKQMGVTERDHLKEYVEDLDKRIALILPHTQIKVLERK